MSTGLKILFIVSIIAAVIGGFLLANTLIKDRAPQAEEDAFSISEASPSQEIVSSSEKIEAPEIHTPPPETPAPPLSLDGLQTKLDTYFTGFNKESVWAVYIEDLDSGSGVYTVYPSQDMEPKISASLIKLYVAGAVMEAANAGELRLGSSLDGKLETMIRDSDNDATNELISLLGSGDSAAGMIKVNKWAQSIGCTDTKLSRMMLDFTTELENYTTVKDCAIVLKLIAENKFIDEQASQKMLDWLTADSVSSESKESKIRAGISDTDTVVANKTGELSVTYGSVNIENDVAIVFSPKGNYIICIMSSPVNPSNARTEIANISKLTYEYFNG